MSLPNGMQWERPDSGPGREVRITRGENTLVFFAGAGDWLEIMAWEQDESIAVEIQGPEHIDLIIRAIVAPGTLVVREQG